MILVDLCLLLLGEHRFEAEIGNTGGEGSPGVEICFDSKLELFVYCCRFRDRDTDMDRDRDMDRDLRMLRAGCWLQRRWS